MRVESAASLAGGVESLGQLPFGLSHVGAAAEQLHGHADRELQRLTPLDVRGRDAHKGRKLIFGFVDLLFQCQDGRLGVESARFCLSHGCIVPFAGSLEGFDGAHVLGPFERRAACDGQLRIEHQQRIVEFGDGCNELCLSGLLVGALGFECRLAAFQGVAQSAKSIDFPLGAATERVVF